MSQVHRLVLGTAAFGIDMYGAHNVTGKSNDEELAAILDTAQRAGVMWLDTAAAYGDAEQRLGRVGVSKFLVVSKMRPWSLDGVDLDNIYTRVAQAVEESLDRLSTYRLEGYLLHTAPYARSPRILHRFLEACERLDIPLRGVSVYDPDQAYAAMAEGSTAIQVPLNLFDLRHMRTGVFAEAERRGVHVFLRAPFLQGVLTQPSPPPHLAQIADRLEILRRWSAPPRVSSMAAKALSAALQAFPPHRVVFGCETMAQLLENLATAADPVPGALYCLAEAIGLDEDAVVNPSLWASKPA